MLHKILQLTYHTLYIIWHSTLCSCIAPIHTVKIKGAVQAKPIGWYISAVGVVFNSCAGGIVIKKASTSIVVPHLHEVLRYGYLDHRRHDAQ